MTPGIGQYLILIKLPPYPQLKEFLLGLKDQWIKIAIYIGTHETIIQNCVSSSENFSKQLDLFLRHWALPDCGQRTVVILHKLTSASGVTGSSSTAIKTVPDKGTTIKTIPPDKSQLGNSWNYYYNIHSS